MTTKPIHPAVEELLKHFNYQHLPEQLQAYSKPLHEIAHTMAASLEGAEVTVGLRKLLEAKDCFVRAAIGAGLITKPGLRTGDRVLVRVPDRSALQDQVRLRPAVVLQAWSATCVNLQVALDGTNDMLDSNGNSVTDSALAANVAWLTSATEGDDVRQWRRA